MKTTQVLSRDRLYKTAFLLSLVTIFYNLAEGIISTIWGFEDETLALFGFGVDSFVEVVSGLGIAHMIYRMQYEPEVGEHDRFEKRALTITGVSFYILAVGLVTGAILSVIFGQNPEATIGGIIISLISIVTMWFLYNKKLEIGHKLDSAPIVSDAKCTQTCFYLSFLLLGSSLLYEFFRIPYVDAVGSIGIAWFAFKEGKEALEKVRNNKLTCSDSCCH
jgi:divalent metal cation (Fe/Co/Zn/Cd) transporter